MSELKSKEDIRAHLRTQFGLTQEQIDSMLPSFLGTLAEYLAELGTHFAADDSVEVGRLAHKTKGALLNLGLPEQAELAKDIETRAKAGADLQDVAADHERLKLELASLLD